MRVPAARDVIQQHNGDLECPEIRVWCHPHRVGKEGRDYYYVCESFREALDFIEQHPESELPPLIAFRGYELNLWDMQPEE